MAHSSANVDALVTAIIRGAFEYQGQKCSAASRAYVPASLWPQVKEKLTQQVNDIKIGSPEDLGNFMGAVIDEKSFDKLNGYINAAKADPDVELLTGGDNSKDVGYFIKPTIIKTNNPKYITMCEELFGPVLTLYVYGDNEFEAILDLVDSTSIYALTGSFFADDRDIINYATKKLNQSAGNFYINDKPTGAVVGQQPFGGARVAEQMIKQALR